MQLSEKRRSFPYSLDYDRNENFINASTFRQHIERLTTIQFVAAVVAISETVANIHITDALAACCAPEVISTVDGYIQCNTKQVNGMVIKSILRYHSTQKHFHEFRFRA